MAVLMGSEALGAVLKDAAARHAGWSLGVGAAGTALTDILAPLGPMTGYLAAAGALGAAVLTLTITTRRVLALRLAPAVVIATSVAVLAGGLWMLQTANQAKAGILAEAVPAVKDLQRRLGLVQQDVAAVRQTVGRIDDTVSRMDLRQGRIESQARQATEAAERTEQQVARLDGGVRDVARETARVAKSLDELARQLTQLSSRGTGLVDDPSSPAEHYHNARLLEARGDGVGARQAYLKVAAADLDAVDVYQRLATLLRVQDGRAGAREVFAELEARQAAPALKLVAATLYDGAERTRRIQAFAAAHPAYAPADLFLADEVSEARTGGQTLRERRAEMDALGRFLAADQDGRLTRHVLDASVLGAWLERARQRYDQLQRLAAQQPAEPRSLFQRSSAGWTMVVQLPEPALALNYRLGTDGAFQPTGDSPAIDPRTGRPMPTTWINFPAGRNAPREIEITYQDIRGETVGPFRVVFDASDALRAQQRQMLDMTRGAWLAFPVRDRPLLYYTQLVTMRCVIREARIVLDGTGPEQVLALPPCDETDPFAVPADVRPFTDVPASTRSVRLRLTLADGTEREATYERP